MTNNQFLDLLYSDISTYIIVMISVLVLYYFIFGRNIAHIADPLMIGYLAQAFSCSVVLFIYIEDVLSDYFFYSFIFTEVAFLLPCAFMRKKYKENYLGENIKASITSEWYANYSTFYLVTLIIFAISSVAYFALAGIPILNQMSRLDTTDSLGALSWFTDVYWVCLPALVIIKRYVFFKKNKMDLIIIGFCFVFLLAKGGKSDFFFLIVSLFLVKEVYKIKELNKVVKYLSYISPLVIIGLMIILFSVWNSDENVIKAFFERFVLFGDVFYQGYNKVFFASLPTNIYPWDYFFGGTINKIKELFGFSSKEKVVFGYEIAKYYYNIDSGIGPNARHNILGLYLFGPYFSVLFSFLIGVIYCAIRSGRGIINSRTPRTSLRFFFYVVFCTYSCFIFVDPSLALGLYLKIIVVFSVPLAISLFISSYRKYFPSTKKNIESLDVREREHFAEQ